MSAAILIAPEVKREPSRHCRHVERKALRKTGSHSDSNRLVAMQATGSGFAPAHGLAEPEVTISVVEKTRGFGVEHFSLKSKGPLTVISDQTSFEETV